MPPTLGHLEGRTFAAVLFDMDGTLIDSTPAVVRSWLRWAEEEGLDPRRLQGRHGVPARGIIAALLPADRVEASVARIEAIEVGDTADLAILPGAAEALRALDGAGVTAIVTSSTAPLARARIDASALAAPDVVVTASDVQHGKPAPDPFLVAARRLGVDPRECLVVEDAPSGLEAARAAGCATLAVTTTSPRHELEAEAIVDTLADVRFALVDGRVRLTGASGDGRVG